jgi:hypothetical protein
MKVKVILPDITVHQATHDKPTKVASYYHLRVVLPLLAARWA